MNEPMTQATDGHHHVFLGTGHEQNERKTWAVIVLCSVMMVVEIVGGSMFGSLALVADGLHMSTHAGAMLIAALAYTYARRHAHDSRFVFGTGKLGDLAGFTSAIVLAMIAVLIGYEAITRFLSPVPIHFAEAIPIAVVGLFVNIVSAWLLSGGEHPGHSHGHGDHEHEHSHDSESRTIATDQGAVELSIFEQGVPPRFRLTFAAGPAAGALPVGVETLRPDGTRQSFGFVNRGGYWESAEEIPEPHEFTAALQLAGGRHEVVFEEHSHDHAPHGGHSGAAHRDNNIRSAYIHVIADAAVSVLAITGLVLARMFGWMWMDPLAGIVGALVIANWSFGLVRDTGRILLDMNPDPHMTDMLREAIESDGDRLVDLHLWRLGPGHLGALVSVLTDKSRDCTFYRERLKNYKTLSHVTVEVTKVAA
ncbi:MAG TPA: CDF family Co(II)/Ni(II) efflux transporter DmeF [Steroidobacteraceae bacterium]|jgi:cation diffusion facilitator family transporter|nr:CDF family Co(II)/Ni(II) efflux transporter DmeF [Steroidobacteraceae bacterium]